MQLFILDQNLKKVQILDEFRSVIWASRYIELGDCEIYVPATARNLEILKKNYYVIRPDDDMVCVIKKIEVESDPESGNYLIVTGVDVRAYLDQRIVWDTTVNNGSDEEFLRRLVTESVISPADKNRRMKKANGGDLFGLGELASPRTTEVSTQQVSYVFVGEKIREVCRSHEWGNRVRLENKKLLFEIYVGDELTQYSVIFSPVFENLETTKYTDDETNLGNVALIGGEGEGSDRIKETYGNAIGTLRSEKFVDADNVSRQVSYESLTLEYPGGTIINSGGYKYRVPELKIPVIDDQHADWLLAMIPGSVLVTEAGAQYVEASNVIIASVPSANPQTTDTCTLVDVIYRSYLITRGAEALSEYGRVVTFDGTIVPNRAFLYKRDYFLGDLVTVDSGFGARATARIVEVIESEDDTGYHVEPKLEYKIFYASPVDRENLTTEGYVAITTEANDPLTTEGE